MRLLKENTIVASVRSQWSDYELAKGQEEWPLWSGSVSADTLHFKALDVTYPDTFIVVEYDQAESQGFELNIVPPGGSEVYDLKLITNSVKAGIPKWIPISLGLTGLVILASKISHAKR